PAFRDTGDYLDFKGKAGKPGNTDRRPVRKWRGSENLVLDCHYRFHLVFRIRVKRRNVDNIVIAAAARLERRLEIGERQTDLRTKIRFRRSVCTTAHLP